MLGLVEIYPVKVAKTKKGYFFLEDNNLRNKANIIDIKPGEMEQVKRSLSEKFQDFFDELDLVEAGLLSAIFYEVMSKYSSGT